jgi:gluconate 5-dehydrogenase
MIEQKYGKIINMASVHANVARLGRALNSYCATKGAVQMLTKELAVEWAQHNITVNALGPSYFESEMTEAVMETQAFKDTLSLYCPMGRMGSQGELDGALIYFASDASSYTTGQTLFIDGGWTAI